jgi:multimeric flavodoxin WrbA
MKALVLSCTLKPSPESSNTESLAAVVSAGLREAEVEVELVRAVDRAIAPGVETDMGEAMSGLRSTRSCRRPRSW